METGCLSWPQKRALKMAFNLVERRINRANQNIEQIHPDQRTMLQKNGENIKTAMNLVGKALKL